MRAWFMATVAQRLILGQYGNVVRGIIRVPRSARVVAGTSAVGEGRSRDH